MNDAPSTAGIALLQDEQFIRAHLSPFLTPDGRSELQGSVGVTVHRTRGDRRGVAEYRFDGGLRVIAKLYADQAKGLAVHAIQSALWEKGFDSGSRYRVPQPIAYLPKHGIMLMHAAPGESLREVSLRSWDRFKEGVAEAARWLAALHRWPHAVGPVADVADDFSRLQRLEREAAVCRADGADRFRAALDELRRRFDSIGTPNARVQTHGRYHIDHVFLAPGCVTVVDLDRAAVSEAARDVGEFLHRLRWEVARIRLGKPAMHEVTEDFLSEYARHSDDDLSGLLYYWSYSTLSALLGSVCMPRPGGRYGNKRLRHLTAEFERVPRLIEALFDRPKRT